MSHAPLVRVSGWTGWLAAVVAALGAAWLAQIGLRLRSELIAAREEAALTQVEAQSTRNLLEAERLVSERQIAELRAAREQLASPERAPDLDRLLIQTLSAESGEAPDARGTVVWSPDHQAGLLVISGLPALRGEQTYRLWLFAAPYSDPVDAGTFVVDAQTGQARHRFRATTPADKPDRFIVTRETNDGGSTPARTTVLSAR